MAATEDGSALTSEYRAGQLTTRAEALQRVARLWGALDATSLSSTLAPFSSSAAVIAVNMGDRSAGETVEYLSRFREAEGVPGAVKFRRALPADLDRVAGLIRGAAVTGIVNSRRSGANLARAKDNALVKVLGDVGKVVLGGGRRTIVRAGQDDKKMQGWERVTSGSACPFCLMLVSRGPVYRSQRSADFEAHGHCACTAEPLYERSDVSGRLKEDWEWVTEGLSGREARAEWRRHVDADRPKAPTAVAPRVAAPPPKASIVPYADRVAAAAVDGDALAVARFGLRKQRPDDFTLDMSGAVRTYTGQEYGAVNAHLRGTRMPYGYEAADVIPVVKKLDSAFALSKTEADAVTYRGVMDPSTMFGDLVDGDLTGMVWSEKAYVSTSAVQRYAARFAGRETGRMVMRVLVPKGTAAIEASGMDLEAELVLARNAKLRVVADRGVNPAGVREIDVEIVG